MSLLFEPITEVAQSSLKGIGKKKMRLTKKFVEHINMLTKAINEVWNIVEAKTYDVDPIYTFITPPLLPLMKIEVQSQEMETRT